MGVSYRNLHFWCCIDSPLVWAAAQSYWSLGMPWIFYHTVSHSVSQACAISSAFASGPSSFFWKTCCFSPQKRQWGRLCLSHTMDSSWKRLDWKISLTNYFCCCDSAYLHCWPHGAAIWCGKELIPAILFLGPSPQTVQHKRSSLILCLFLIYVFKHQLLIYNERFYYEYMYIIYSRGIWLHYCSLLSSHSGGLFLPT